MIDVLAPVAATASRTVLKTGSPWTCWPSRPGVVPPTTLVPYSSIWPAWNEPSRPVNPWTSTRVLLSTRMLTCSSHLGYTLGGPLSCLDDLLGGLRQRFGGGDPSVGKYLAARLLVCSRQPDDERNLGLDRFHRFQETASHIVAAGDAAEDVDQNGTDLRL